jgi:monoamine oxidase
MAGSLFNRLRAQHGTPVDGPTRREMLRLTLLGATGLLLSNRVTFGQQSAAGRRVLIVGGGFAGLAAAHELSSVGYDVRVFEARNRLGGRVLTFHDLAAGKSVEGGGELIGSNHPAWVAYKDKFKLRFLDVTEEKGVSPVVLGGRLLTKAEGAQLYEEMDAAYGRHRRGAVRGPPRSIDRRWRIGSTRRVYRRCAGRRCTASSLPTTV